MDNTIPIFIFFSFVVYSMAMVPLIAYWWNVHCYTYPKQGFKLKYLIVFILAPHSTIFTLGLISVEILGKMVLSSKPYEKVINFINKDLF